MYFTNPVLIYFNRLIIAISILINVILGGKSNQTFSARNYGWKLAKQPNLVWLIDALFWFDKDHCELAWEFWITIKEHYPADIIFR
jgi:hypothetical protein